MRIFSKALVLFWASILLVASTCIGADVHYCKGDVQSFAVFEVAKPCKMAEQKPVKELPPCCKARKEAAQKAWEGKPVFKQGKCCYNDQVAFKSDGEQHTPNISIDFPQLPQVAVLNNTQSEIVWSNYTQQKIQFRGPPDVVFQWDFQIFFQVFQI